MKRKTYSRLQKIERKKTLKTGFLFIFLTIVLGLTIVFAGIPFLVKMAMFLGNMKSSGVKIETNDTIPPSPPKIALNYEATNSAKLSFEGFAEPSANVSLFLNQEFEKEVVVDNEGKFVFDQVSLQEGDNFIYAIAADEAGNESAKSTTINMLFDKTPPEIEILNPQDGQSFSQIEKQIDITGFLNEEASLWINNRTIIVNSKNEFSYSYTLVEGENTLSFKAIDKAGNSVEKEIKVTYSF
jgi:bacillopeptidase F